MTASLLLLVTACAAPETPAIHRTAPTAPLLAKTKGQTTYSSMALSSQSTCAVAKNGNAYCWGLNNYAQLGDGTIGGFSAVPRPVAGGHSFTRVAHNYTHGCGLEQDETVWCWGFNDAGQLGVAAPLFAPSPVLAAGGARFKDVDVGAWHTCAIRSDPLGTFDGIGYCWGNNAIGQLGNAITGPLFNPDPVQIFNFIPRGSPTGQFTPLRFLKLDLGTYSSCGRSENYDSLTYQVILRSYIWMCWGSNAAGTFGDGTVLNYPNVPIPAWKNLVPQSVTALDYLAEHTCVIARRTSNLQVGGAFCSGLNVDGQLGDGTTITRVDPTPVSGGSDFQVISAGSTHSCALNSRGAAYCWGANDEGQLGTGDLTPSLTPVAVATTIRFEQIFASNRFTCALTKQGEAYCWGRNELGELGDGTQVRRTTPVAVLEP